YVDKLVLSKLTKYTLTLLIVGGIGFLMAFYVAGANSIPRRYSTYPVELTSGPYLAKVGALFATIYLIAILIFFYNIAKRCFVILSASSR
ncbi:MAG TPA: hypothetical protein PLD87_11120, partial [Bacteroidia bacterium]|nr:hypothetical protein [Bacteroidia bacterium]